MNGYSNYNKMCDAELGEIHSGVVGSCSNWYCLGGYAHGHKQAGPVSEAITMICAYFGAW